MIALPSIVLPFFIALALLSSASPARQASAFWTMQHDDLARIGEALGAKGHSQSLRMPSSRNVQRIAIATSIHAIDAHVLLPSLAEIASTGDRSLALSAAKSARHIAFRLDSWSLTTFEIPNTRRVKLQSPWLDLALDEDAWIDLRIVALEIANALSSETIQWEQLVRQIDPEFRAAVFEIMPAFVLQTAPPWFVKELRDETNDMVLGRAMWTLCLVAPSSASTVLFEKQLSTSDKKRWNCSSKAKRGKD